MQLPKFVCVGAPKSGTTALQTDMMRHPDVFLPPIKETHFFRLAFEGLVWNGPGTPPPMNINTLEKYKAIFAKATTQKAIGEICPSYFVNPRTPQHIYDTLGQVKIIIILRDPAARAYSQFLHARLIGCEPEPSFLKALALEPEREAAQWGEFWAYLEPSYYAPVLERYFSIFGRENVLVLRHDHYVRNREETLSEIYEFIGVDPKMAHNPDAPSHKTNISGIPKNRVAAFAFKHVELIAKIARVMVPAPLRKKVRSMMDKSLQKASLTTEERRYVISRLSKDIEKVEELTGWDLADWKTTAP